MAWSGRRLQPADPNQDRREQRPRHRHLRQLVRHRPRVMHDLRADLDPPNSWCAAMARSRAAFPSCPRAEGTIRQHARSGANVVRFIVKSPLSSDGQASASTNESRSASAAVISSTVRYRKAAGVTAL